MAGAVDVIDNFGMAGWACTDDGATACQMRVDIDGVPMTVFFPTDFRPDLAAAGWAKGYCSLDVSFPKAIAPFEPARVEVWNGETGTLISRPGLVIGPAIRKFGKYAFEDPTDIGSANPTAVTVDGDTRVTHGVAVYPSGRNLQAQKVGGDAQLVFFHQEEAPSPILSKFGLAVRTFSMGTRSDSNQPFSLYCVSPIGYSSKRTAFTGLVAVTAGHPGDSEAPPQANMVRVSGSGVTREVFAAAGLTTAAKLNGVGEAFAGRPLSAFKTILDWGAGSGRVARPLATYFAPDAELWCVDVDSVNVEWGRKTNFVPNGRWQTIPFYPPTNLPAEHFDFIYGISVFTHLTEAAQEVWLKELSRISHSGALLVMSANTEFCATRFAERGTGHLRDLLIYGIADRLIDGNLGPHLSRGNYYRSTYHLTEYVRAVWGQYFEVLDLIHAADSHVQDFVVLRKR